MATLVADNLTFAYTKKSKPVLNKVSVEIKPGTLTALVGPNGAGTVSYTHLTLPTI